MTSIQTVAVNNLLRLLRRPSQWAEVVTTGDDRVVIAFGTIHSNGDRETAIGHYTVEPDGKTQKFVGA